MRLLVHSRGTILEQHSRPNLILTLFCECLIVWNINIGRRLRKLLFWHRLINVLFQRLGWLPNGFFGCGRSSPIVGRLESLGIGHRRGVGGLNKIGVPIFVKFNKRITSRFPYSLHPIAQVFKSKVSPRLRAWVLLVFIFKVDAFVII